MNSDSVISNVDAHVRQFFAGHSISVEQWTLGPMPEEMPRFRVLRIAPGERSSCWTYCSIGASTITHEQSGLLEFFVLAPRDDLRHVELVTMAAYYHWNNILGPGHTLPMGERWVPQSRCDHLLISTPYPFGPEFEICQGQDEHVHILWLLPITESERDFKVENGLEALEQRFEDSGLEYWDVTRNSVV